MPFKITCANGHAMMIRDEHAGRRVKCPTCGIGIEAADPSAAPPTMSPASATPAQPPMARLVMDAILAEEDDSDLEPHADSGDGVPLGWIVGGVAAVVVVLLLAAVGLAWYFISRPDVAAPPQTKPVREGVAESARPAAERPRVRTPANKPADPAPSKPTEPPTPRTPLAGPIAHWGFDEDEGDVVKDVSGNGLHAKLVGCKRVAGIHGKGIEFAGQGTYFEYGGGPAFNFEADAPFSFAFWFRSSDRGGTLLCQRKRDQEAPMIRLTFDPFGIGAEVCGDHEGRGPLPARVNATLKVNDGQWRHVTLVRAGNDLELFIDGESRAKTTNPVAGSSITTDLRHLGVEGYHLAHGEGYDYPHFKGVMDDFYIYGRELSAEEIRKLASK